MKNKIMLLLTKKEIQSVAGGLGGFLGKMADKAKHMGGGRDYPVKCYGSDQKVIQGWNARDWAGAKWFCCDSNKHHHVVMGTQYMDCNTRKEGKLSVSLPDDLSSVAVSDL